MAIGNASSEMRMMVLMKIETMTAYEKKIFFIKNIKARYIPSQHYYRNVITQLDPSEGVTTTDGGSALILH